MFHILNGTDMTSDPVPVPALLVVMAIEAANAQEVDSYPVRICRFYCALNMLMIIITFFADHYASYPC